MLHTNTPMDSSRYTVEYLKHEGPIEPVEGYYQELCIENNTGESIWCIDTNNNRLEIKTTYRYMHEKFVKVYARDKLGKREFSSYSKELWSGKVLQLTITYGELCKGPIYVKEIDSMLCLYGHKDLCQHVHSVDLFSRSKEQVVSYITEALINPAFSVIANDPSGVVDNLYLVLNGVLTECPVSNSQYSPKTLQFVFRNSECVSGVQTLVMDFDDVMGSSGLYVHEEIIWHIGINRTQVVHQYNQYKRNELTKLDVKTMEQSVKDLNRRHKLELTGLEEKIQQLQDDIRVLDQKHKMEMITVQSQTDHYKNILDIHLNKTKMEHEQSKLKSESITQWAKTALAVFTGAVTVYTLYNKLKPK